MGHTVGMELEMVCDRDAIAGVVLSAVGGQSVRFGEWPAVVDDQRRVWRIIDDSSINARAGLRAELVTPVLEETELDLVEEIGARLIRAGAYVNQSCGLHVHVGSRGATFDQLIALVRYTASIELPVFVRMLEQDVVRRRRFARLLADVDVARLLASASGDELYERWYDDADWELRSSDRYDEVRYRGLNLHSHLNHQTIEFRYFNGTLDPGLLRGIPRLCLGIVEEAGIPPTGGSS